MGFFGNTGVSMRSELENKLHIVHATKFEGATWSEDGFEIVYWKFSHPTNVIEYQKYRLKDLVKELANIHVAPCDVVLFSPESIGAFGRMRFNVKYFINGVADQAQINLFPANLMTVMDDYYGVNKTETPEATT